MDPGVQIVTRLAGTAFIIFAVYPAVGFLWRHLKQAVFPPRQVEAQCEALLAQAQARRLAREEIDSQPRPHGEIKCQQTGWHIDGSEIFNRYGYTGMLSAEDEVTMRIECTLSRAFKAEGILSPVQAHFLFILNPGLLKNEGYIIGILSSEKTSKSTGYISMRAGPAPNGTMVAQISEVKDCATALELMLSGEDCFVEFLAKPGASMARLRFPVGSGFNLCYRELSLRIKPDLSF